MRHDELGVLRGDVLIHVGDMFDLFAREPDDLARVDDWFGRQQFDLILCIAGNHDRPLERPRSGRTSPFRNVIYLEDERIEHKGVTFYGSPWVPDLPGHAFHAPADVLRQKWAAIPEGTDVLITHTPPAGILDQSSRGQSLGCQSLADAVEQICPRLHCFGHVHASGGSVKSGATTYVNAASLHRADGPLRRPKRFRI